MSGTLTVANLLRAGKAGTMPAFLSSTLTPAATPMTNPMTTPDTGGAIALPPTPPITMLNANRNVIPDTTAPAMLSAAPAAKPAALVAQDRMALLKKWWPWILLALLAAAVLFTATKRRKRSE